MENKKTRKGLPWTGKQEPIPQKKGRQEERGVLKTDVFILKAVN